MPPLSLAVFTLWWREVTRFRRQRSRVVGSLLQPLVFWLLLGGGFSASFRPPGMPPGTGYLEYFYPGVVVLVMLFTAVFATISVIEDRREGFLQGVLVAPVPRTGIVLGQALGGTTLALGQGLLFLLLAPLVGIAITPAALLAVVAVLACLAFALTNLGLLLAWRMESTQGFHALMNLLLIPMWLLSGAVFPLRGVPAWLVWTMYLNPLTYGMAVLRRCLSPNSAAAVGLPLGLALAITLSFAAVTLLGATWTATRRTL
ncbi:MAG: transport permease protein [Candidatus Tectimicrobiota bacterium]|nr:MAG: transport permease protein [Candidatus Tectomicrobia bacterium]